MDGISFIGGGRMAEAMIRGLLKAGLVAADRVSVADPDVARRELLHKEYGVQVFEDAAAVWGNDLVVLAVKPQVVQKVLAQCRPAAGANHLLVSIAAGIAIATLEAALAGSNTRVIRVMPNTPALVQQGAAALSPGTLASAADLQTARQLFDAVGVSVILAEPLLDAVTGLSGSGPAYVLSFVEALIDAGIKAGLDQVTSRTLVLQTVLGTATMAMQTGEHPAQLRAMVTSPGGTTIAGLQVMERAGFGGIVMEAVEAAVRRSRELGQPRG
ncbi:MAG: pyrroline-5-carboxylate reductase [Deltaproteobacteria bacterium CG_4_10_14_3_um_filter_60_8]|nr:MAG: pyrroline-5-carboxylate reductase [Desulfobacterales bacterium CG2_30_60_27]PIP44298.1 MAG: pyrroline-5-carboxylate reductase [Deltaproteobacteria bacterium CG23_combo_of_CG06-09_8_20_14_all_60_8]PIY24232.1 MAG: pyrroline-5-carboxylate reductase [Deltaproteobacteria bacterium CG_4_10_14_3_um_filter_60_8]